MTSANDISYIVLIPESVAEPVVVYCESAALRIAVVDRASVGALNSEDWDRPGAYVLLDRPGDDGTFGAYVGKATGPGLKSRVSQHVRGKDSWYRAVLVRSDTTHGFNSAHAAWLEGRVFDLLDAAAAARLSNGQRPRDDTLAPYEQTRLEASIDPIARLLRVLGHDTSTPSDSDPTGPLTPQTRTHVGVKLPELVEAGLLAPGIRLVSTLGTAPADATVTADGCIEWDGTVYQTPSGAGDAVAGRAVNGWDFWAVETDSGKVRLSTLRARLLKGRLPE